MKKWLWVLVILPGFTLVCADSGCSSEKARGSRSAENAVKNQDKDSVVISEILNKINSASQNLKTCEARLSYLFIQDPELLDSRTLRNGMLYFKKEKNRSNLRIRFDDIKEDDFNPKKEREEILFDGVWLTHIQYKLEQVDRYQQAPEDKPIGVFELINDSFPMIGFSGSDQIQNEFDIKLDKAEEPNSLPCLILTVQKESKYKENYNKILFWVDKDTSFPRKVIAYTPQGDESHVEFDYLNVNKKLENTVFKLETPKHFRENREPLKKEPPTRK